MLRNNTNIYLQSLIKELWFKDVNTFDASMNQTFKTHIALIWMINDFPSLGTLPSWNTYSRLAYPTCKFDAIPLQLAYI